jgi:hypothetical protein
MNKPVGVFLSRHRWTLTKLDVGEPNFLKFNKIFQS